MKQYNYANIDEHIQWLMRMMDTEYPNNYELVITRNYAEIRNTQTELNFGYKEQNLNFKDENLLNGFFNGEYYITFNTRKEKEEFLKYISYFDKIYNTYALDVKEDIIENMQSAIWIHSDSQFRYAVDKTYFKNEHINFKSYKEISKEIKDFIKAADKLKQYMESVNLK